MMRRFRQPLRDAQAAEADGDTAPAVRMAAAHKRLRPTVVTLVAVGLIALLIGIDWYTRNAEMDRLVTAIAVAERAESQGRDAMDDAFRRNADASAGSPGRVAAGAAVEPVSDAVNRIEEVSVLPWHRSIKTAKARYLRHAGVWVTYFNGIADNEDVRSAYRQISPTFQSAMRVLTAAVPRLPLHHLTRRINAFE